MTRNELKRKEIIESTLLKSMGFLDEAMSQIIALDTETDNNNYSKISQCKSEIRRVLQRDYDRLACNRN